MRGKFSERDKPLVERLLDRRKNLRDLLAALLPDSIDLHKIRHHGDFHLGQMLIVRDDIFIIDFEGEPRRSFAERRMKAPAARDVAGLVRSIDYSVTSALDRHLKLGSDEDGRIATALAGWRDDSIATFLATYREATTDSRLWPADRAASDNVLRFFLLEKAFYEIDYELSHRPDWLHVALDGALRALNEGTGA
jgi:maltose alpha-D-glucosyltransferase/alpha-amylase